MGNLAIQTRALGKRYRVGGPDASYRTLREALMVAVSAPVRNLRRLQQLTTLSARESASDFWALHDISLDVRHGEVLGIVGRNGAGKSTLLKILSRITAPTVGEAVLHGRVGALLEVGTGFHPELTGRDNIFLSGSILGMDRGHIQREFDAIVEFAGVERFVDTPVKRYSSGMYLRLAFAVAAHLEPEILIVDEVLAVGDAEFQRKCLGRMDTVSREGRTVLFVSHNMGAVQRLCSRVVMLEDGRIAHAGPTAEVVRRYLSSGPGEAPPLQPLDLTAERRSGSGQARFTAAQYSSGEESIGGRLFSGGPLEIGLTIDSEGAKSGVSLAISLYDQHGTKLLNADTDAIGTPVRLRRGLNTWKLRIESLHLKPGIYTVGLWLAGRQGDAFDRVDSAFRVEVVDLQSERLGVRIDSRYDGVVTCDFTAFRVAPGPGSSTTAVEGSADSLVGRGPEAFA